MHEIKIVDLMKNEVRSITYFINTNFNMMGIDIPEKTDTDFSNIVNALSQYYGIDLNTFLNTLSNYHGMHLNTFLNKNFCSLSLFHMSGSNVEFENEFEEKIKECKPFKTLLINTDNTTEIGGYTLKGIFLKLTASEVRSAIIYNDEDSIIYYITK